VDRGAGERLLHGVLGVRQIAGDGVELDDEAPVVAGVEVVEVAVGHAPSERVVQRCDRDTLPGAVRFQLRVAVTASL
jgi:hypothetical protein